MVQASETESRVYAERKLMEQVKKAYPETKNMTYTGLVDWGLRKLLAIKGANA